MSEFVVAAIARDPLVSAPRLLDALATHFHGARRPRSSAMNEFIARHRPVTARIAI
jgi:hypothetical protein